ncbi:MAG: hypothetical protein ACKO6B_07195, partial [Planctomycetia bacterium]
RRSAVAMFTARMVRGRLPGLRWAILEMGLVIAVQSPAAEPQPSDLFDDAVRLFFEAKPAESARVFDRLVSAVPTAEPELWQRGLALYYAERFDDGSKQFESHRTVNPNDVENAAWHFLCVARLAGPRAARARLLPVGEDARVPMKQVMDLYAGRCEPADVLAAAERGAGEARRNQLCYAHLYLGLFFEATGNAAKAREHMQQAAGAFSMDHYMGKVAAVHCRLRGWADDDDEGGK